MSIFGSTAPGYYARGISVIPLHVKEKRPIPLDWSRFHDQPVPESEQAHWIRAHSMGNIGMVLGKQSGIMMLDIDTEDKDLIDVILGLVPESPWVRVGQKGMVLAFKYSGLRTFRIKTAKGESVCELLSDRTQCVLPPSIHPKTMKPYVANCDLLEVIDSLPMLNSQIETLLRAALTEAGVDLSSTGQSQVTDFVSRGSRDVSMTEKAGLFAYAVVRGERTVMEAIGMLRSVHREFVERVAGDDVEVEKHVDNLFRFLRRDVIEKNKILPEGWDTGLSVEDKKRWGIDFDGDQVEWSFDELRNFLKDKFVEFSDAEDATGRANAVDRVLTKISRSKQLNKLDEERLLTYIMDVGNIGLRLASLRMRLHQLRQGDVLGTDHSEIARLVLRDLEELYEVRRHGGRLWKYTGSHWEPIPEGTVLARISNDFGHLLAARKNNDHKGIMQIMTVIAKEGIKEREVRGVNFANGFLNQEMELVKHRHEYGMTYTLPFRYMPELAGKSRLFFEFLEQSWGMDEDYGDKILMLQEALCVTLFGLGPQYQRAILLRGVAKSGKSQLLKIAQSLVPENAVCFVPPNDWSDKFLPTMMHEKLINVCGELSETKRIDGQKFKDIVDGSERSGQLKGQQIFRFSPACVHWFASNHTPKTEDSSEGFNRRLLFLEFNHPVAAKDRKTDLGNMIVAEEREAIVAWAVLALPRLQENREYTLSKSHIQQIREVAQANNSVRFFMEACPTIRVGNSSDRILEDKLYKEYWGFCLGPGGARPVTSRSFRTMMRDLQTTLGFQVEMGRTSLGADEVYYRSITVVTKKAGVSSS